MILTIHEPETFSALTSTAAFSDLVIWWRYDGISEMKVVLPVRNDFLIEPDMLISAFNGANTIGNDAFLVETVTIEEKSNGDFMRITAYSVGSMLLQRRALPSSFTYEGTGGYVIKRILDSVFSSTAKQYPNFTYDIDTSIGDGISYQMTPTDAMDAIMTICRASGLGFGTEFNAHTRQLLFKISYGQDRTGANPAYTPVVFEAGYFNISNVRYNDSVSNYSNVIYVLGERIEQSESRKMVIVDPGNAVGYKRREVVVDSGLVSTTDQKDYEGNNIILSTAQYNALLTSYGQEQIAIRVRSRYAEGELITDQGFVILNKDYFNGDIVTVRSSKWGTVVYSRLKEVVEEYSGGIRRVYITVGNRMPTLTDKIRRR